MHSDRSMSGDYHDPTDLQDAFKLLETECPVSNENLHNKAHDVFPIPFAGGKLVINKGLSPNFQVNHSILLTRGEQIGYRFGATYVGHGKVSETEVCPVLIGEVQPNGDLQAQVIHCFSKNLRMRYLAQIQGNKMLGQQFATDFKKNRWQIGVTVINPDVEKKQFMSAIDVMRQVTPHFAFGTMFFAQISPQLPSGRDGMWSLGMRYTHSSFWSTALSLRPFHNSFHTSFHMRANENLQMAAEFESNFQQQSNIATIGYQFDLPKTNVTFKSQIDSNMNVASTLEKKMLPFPFTLTLSAMGSLLKSHYEIGIGLIVG
ncbi:Mitochondrial import receptor subunit TOM40B [Cichlidogyrus casuarinus]|uniref:Mitochondrial import receptor subunit TOM40B n=1 Tax=Cichlidogyrus casuarinus TaxID=1844966 RepID=A0ABD2QB28_9PLAT